MIITKRLAGVLLAVSYFLPAIDFLEIGSPYETLQRKRHDLESGIIAVVIAICYFWPLIVLMYEKFPVPKLSQKLMSIFELVLCTASIFLVLFFVVISGFTVAIYGAYLSIIAILAYGVACVNTLSVLRNTQTGVITWQHEKK